MEVTNIGNKFGEEILNQQADSIEENHSRAQSSEIHEEIDALERLTIDSIEALCQPKSIDFTSWISKGSDVTIDTRSRREIPQERLLIHLEQFVVYCARQGWINELHFAFAALPCETSISLCLGVLRELPANISPTLYKHLLPTVSVVSCRGTGTNKSLVFQNLEHKDLSVSVKRALEGEWNNNDASGPGSIKVLADIHNSLSPLQLCSHTMLQKHLVQWYMQKAFEIDAVGYSYHAYQLLAVAVESAEGGADGAIEEKQDHQAVVLAVLVELHLQLYQFCRHLYDSVISADTLFIDWLAASLHDKLVWLISAEGNQENASRTFAEVLMNYLIPTLEGEYSLLQSTTLQQFIVNLSELHAFDCCAASAAVKVNTLVLHAQKGTTASVLAAGVVASADPHHSRASHIDWQQQLAVALAHTVAPFDLAALERVASVVAASKPTLSRAQRCIRSDAALVELVVRTCFSYDDVHSGLEVMWQLIECTPAERLRDQHALLSDELDALQLALNTCELLKPYIPVPALSVLVPLPAFIGADGSHYRSKADNKMLRFRYKQQLLIGASFLYSRVMTVLGGGPVLSQKRKLASSSSEESLDRKINFGEAVVMKVCYEFGEKMTHATKEGRMSYLVAHTWVQLTEDLFDVCNVSVFKEDLSLHWVGVLLLTCLQHFRASEFKAVVKYLFTTAPSVVAAHGPPAHNTKKDLGFVLLNKFELSPILVQRFLLNQSRELVNSLSSCWDEESLAEVKSARDLLKMIPDEYASSETFAEFALHDLLHTLSAIKLDFIPLQLRLLSPVDIARRILFERPDAYYTIIHKDESSTAKSGVSNGSSGGDSGYSDVGCEEDPDSPWSPVVRSVAAKKAALKVQDIAGMKFVQTLLTIYSVANLVADDSDGDDAEADDWKYAESILLLLVNAALVVGDLERAFVYCNYLLDEDRFNTSSSALQDEIISSVTLVMEALTNEEEQRIERALGKALREDLLCSIVRSASIEQFDRLRHLWRSTEPVVVHKNGSFVPQSTGAEPSTALDNAKVLLYDFVASTLQQVHHSSTPAEKYRGVLSKSAIVLALQEALGYLVQMEDSRQAIALLDGISKDLQKKLVKAVELQNRSRKMGTSMAAPDENVIQQLMNKGFSRNGAKRAVLNTRNAGVNVALAWAIEHSLDEDFEHPIAQQVRGALLSEEVASGAQSAAFAVDDIQETFDFIQAVAAAYRFRVGLPPVAPLSSASIIREERAQIVRVHGAASTLSEQPASLDSSAAPSPLVSSLFGHHGPSRTQAAGKITKKVSKASLGARRIVEPTSAQATPTTVDSSKFFDDVEDSSIPPSREVQSAGAVVLDAPSTSHKALPVEPVASDAPSVANDHYNSSAVGLDGPSSKGLGDGALDTWPDRSDGTGESVGALAASEETTAAAEADWPDDELKDLDDISEEGRAIAKVSLTASDIGGPAVPTEGWPDDELEGLDASDDKHDKHEFSGAVSQLEVEEPTDNIPPVIPLGAAEEEPRGDVSAWPDDELEGLDDDEVAEQRPCEKIDDPAALEHAHGDSSAIDGSEQQLDVSDTAAVITTATACAEDTSDAAWPDDELEGLDEVSVEDHPTQPETHTTEHAPHEVVEMNSPVTNDVIEPAESAEGWPDDELEGLDASDDKHEFSGAVPQLQVDEPADTTQVVTAAATEEPSAGVSAWSDGELEGLDDDVEVNRVVANIEGKLQYVSTASAAAVDIVTAAEEVSESAGAWPEDELDGLDELLADEPQQNPALREFSASHDVVSACTDVVVDSTLAGCWPEDDLEDLDDDEDDERLNANQQQPASDDHIGHSGYVDQGADEELVLDAEEAVGVAPMATGNTFATAEGWPNEELGELELQDVDQLRDEGSAVAPGAAAGEHPTGDCESLPTTVYATGGAGWAEDALDGLDDLSETGEQRPSADVESAATTTAMAGEGQVQVAAESNSLTIKEGAFWRDDELAGLSGSDADIVQSTDDAHVVDEVVTCNSVEALDGFDDMEGKTSPNYSSPVQAAATDHEVLSDIVCAEEGSANGNESAEGSPDEELDDVEKSYDEANHPAVEFTEPASASMSPVFEEVGLDVNAADLNAPCNTQEGWRDEALESLDDVDAEPTLTEPPSSATATPIAATTVDAADVISSAGWLEDELRDRSDGGLQEEHSRLAEEALIPASAGSTAEIDFCNSQGAHMGAPKVQSRAEGWPSDELDGFKESDADDVDQAPIHQTERAASGDVVADGDTAAPVPDAGEGDGGGGWPDEDIEGLDDVDTDDRAQTFKEPRNVQATAAVAPQTSEDTEYCAPDSNSTGNGWAEEELDGLDDSDLDVVEEQERKGPQDTPIAGAAFAGAVEVLSEAAKGFVGDQLASNVTVTSAAEYATSMAGAIADTIAHVGWADADLEGLDDLEVEESPSSEEQELSISATATTVFEQQVVASTTGWLEDELDGLNDSIGDGDGPEDPPSTGDSNLGVISAAVAAAASFVTTEVLSSTNTVDPTADNISQEGWPEVDLEGLVDSDLDAEEQKPSAAAESTDNAGVLSDEDSDLTAIIESALEVAADVVGFAGTAPGASFNASRAAMHIAAFESAASKCNSSTHPAVSPAATATEGECAESLQAVHALCTQLAVSENDVALDCLLQFAASIPYVHFLRWLTEQMSTADLHLGDISALPVGEEDSAEALQEAVIWHVQALRFTANFSREGFDVEVDYPKEFLSRDPLRLILVLASLFVSASATDLFRLEFLKKAALEILESSDFADPLEAEAQTLDVLLRSNSLLRAEYSAETPPASPKIENVIELLKKQLLEDSALLRRISRVEGNHGVDCKAIIQSESLLSCVTLRAPSAAQLAEQRRKALQSLCPVLQLHTVVAWNRAVGRVLDVGPSQLHAYFVLYQLHQYRHAAATTNTPTNTSTTIPVYEANLPDLEHILKESASKMKPAHIEVLGLLITGVAPSRVEELKGLKLLSFPVTTATATAATPEEHHRSAAIPWAASESLLTTLLTALRKGSNSGETSTRAGRGASAGTSRKAREVSEGTETSSSSGGPENDQLSQLVARLLDFGAGVANLPTDILQDLYSSRFGDTEAMEALLPPILLREDISPTAALEACASLTTYHADLCKLILSKAGCSSTLLSQLNDSAEVDVKIEQTLHAVWLQQVSQLGQRCAHGDVEEVFLHHCSAFHSLLHKASNLLNQVALRRFSEVVIATLSRLASAKSTDSDVAPISPQSTPAILLGEVSLADHVQWIAAGVVSAVAPGGLALLVGIHVLTHWGLELQRADQQEEDVVAGEGRSTQLRSGLHARSLLLSRLLLASLHSSTETALFRDICLASSSVPSSTGHSTDNVYDIEDPAQWDALVVTLLESDDGISAAHLQIILALHQQRCVLHQNLCTLVDGSADTSVVQLFSLPLKLQYLQRAFAIHHVTEPTSSPPVHACASSSLSMPTCAKMLKALAKVQMHGEFVQFMLVDMQLLCGSGVQGGDSPQWRQNARIMDIVYMLLPERSCWKRQALICLGGDHAESAFAELEEVISERKASHTQKAVPDSSDDGLTMLLLLWLNPSPCLLQRTLASPSVYPLLASLVLQCHHHRVAQFITSCRVSTGSSSEGCEGFSLQNILRMFFNGPPTGSANAALSADEAVIQLPQVLCLDNLIVLLVLTGRIPAAAELNWRALRRPVALYTVRSGVACLIAMLRESVAMGHVSSVEALQVLEEIEGV